MKPKSAYLAAFLFQALPASQVHADAIRLACEITSGTNRGSQHRFEIDTVAMIAIIDGFLPAEIMSLDDKISLMVAGRTIREFLPHLCSENMCVGETIIIDRYLGTLVWANYFGSAGEVEDAHRGSCVAHDGEMLF